MLPTYRVNIDYEFDLYSMPKPRLYLGENFEFVIFLSEERDYHLFTKCKYSKNYLSYLDSLGFILPLSFTQKPNFKNWWGELCLIEHEQRLNNKKTALVWSQNLGLVPSTVFIANENNLKSLDLTEQMFIKRLAGSSGRSNFFWDASNLMSYPKWCQKEDFILSPYFKRVVDIGHVCLNGKNFESHILINNKRGQFLGGIVFDNQNHLSDLLCRLYLSYEEETHRVYSYILHKLKSFASKPFGIDSFIYEDRSRMAYYPLVELNYRKSMGFVLHKLKRFLPKDGIGGWFFYKKSKLFPNNFEKILSLLRNDLYSVQTKRGIIPTSPEFSDYVSFFVCAHDKTEFLDLENIIVSLFDLPSRVKESSPFFDK